MQGSAWAVPGVRVLLAALATVVGLSGAVCATPYFMIDSEIEWNEAFSLGNVQPMTTAEWGDYMFQWANFLVEGEPYPSNTFVPPQLYVWGGGGGGGTDPEDAGLVMVWRSDLSGEFSSAWKYVYTSDPDLTGTTINVTVTPPQFSPSTGAQVNTVSFGIQDQFGAIRSWNWTCGPGGLPWNMPTQITINPGILSVFATNPVASGFANNPVFQLTQSQNFIVDENAKWVGGAQGIPPPGQSLSGMWNYWHNIFVTPPIPPKFPDPIKWSQPVVEAEPGLQPPLFLGWDEPSLYTVPPICADDWECKTPQPVTDVHWWGSFVGWTQPEPPMPLPSAFHLAIWTDVPASPSNPYSHPGRMIWEHYCDTFTWNFAGYDKDPRNLVQNEACFQFHQYIPPDKWFYQDPGPTGRNVYWLSIAAIYDISIPQYPWGWKTRPHFFNDDAVRIWQVWDPTGMSGWPPHVGWMWAQGEPIMWEQTSWDLAFELTTREEAFHDLGDAPDSTNNIGSAMTAYPAGGPPGVTANYPTAFQGGVAPTGPLHQQPTAVAFLGNAVTKENEADGGPDQDPTNNIQPATDTPDLDLADDCLTVPLALPHCQPATFSYVVTIVSPPTQALYVNAWFDWNRDGDWDDTLLCSTGSPVPEWAVQNQVIPAGTASGVYTFVTPPFLPWHPTGNMTPIWMRITLAEQPWQPGTMPGWGGSGPAAGYVYGETEDYYFTPVIPEEWDWGDAPDPPYPTLASSNGASHKILGGFCLGSQIDSEGDGIPDPNALGDDSNNLDDEDGVTFGAPLIPGQNGSCVVTVTGIPGQTYFLDAWIDFNGNGLWTDAGDQIAASAPVVNGPNTITFAVPNGIATGVDRIARFRLSTTGGLGIGGAANDGEVEDHEAPIGFKWVQQPDLDDTGIDVNCTQPFILADDFQCTVTGPITDIHVWGSWYHDILPFSDPNHVRFRLSIHKDIPAQPGGEYSRPGEVVWLRDFGPGQFRVREYASNLVEGWMDPPTRWEPIGDHTCWLYEFDIVEDPFIQRGTPENPVVYWLDVQAEPLDGESRFGWKTSKDHWNDDAVWGQGIEPYPGPWYELRYPPQHPWAEQSIDLAFAITGSAGQVPVGTLTVKYNQTIPDHFWWRSDPDPDNEMISLNGAADAVEAISWDTITLQASGTGNDATDIISVDVWLDSDNDGKVTPGDALLGSGVYPVDDGTVTIALAPAPIIPPNGIVPLVVSYRMSLAPTVALGSTFWFDVIGATGTGQTSGMPVTVILNPSPLISAKKIVGLRPITIGEAKKLLVGSPVLVEGKIVTADFLASMGLFYIEEPNRSSGIGVMPTAIPGPITVGDRASVLGNTFLLNGTELVIQPLQMLFSPGAPLTTVGMCNKYTGGGVFGGQPAVMDDAWNGIASGVLNNVGLLERTWGTVTYYQVAYNTPTYTGDMLWINDGCNLADGFTTMLGNPTQGICCVVPTLSPVPSVGDYYGVTGIMRAVPNWMGQPVRMLVPRGPADMLRHGP